MGWRPHSLRGAVSAHCPTPATSYAVLFLALVGRQSWPRHGIVRTAPADLFDRAHIVYGQSRLATSKAPTVMAPILATNTAPAATSFASLISGAISGCRWSIRYSTAEFMSSSAS